MSQDEPSNRRPLAVRNLKITQAIARWLSRRDIAPNTISIMSVVFAALGCLDLLIHFYFPHWAWLLLAALFIQLRLQCNLFDGMVAVEGGKKTPAGELFNDLPDRLADPLFIMGAGFVTGSVWGFMLAWACALLAVLTAYIRILGVSMGARAHFEGPMAKQHRMALLTVVYLLLAASYYWQLAPKWEQWGMDLCLGVMLIGLIWTCWRRVRLIYQDCSAAKEPADV